MFSAHNEREGRARRLVHAIQRLPWQVILKFARRFRYDELDVRVFDEADDAELVFNRMSAALGLIASTDSLRYRRIGKHVSRLLVMSGSGGFYLHQLRTNNLFG